MTRGKHWNNIPLSAAIVPEMPPFRIGDRVLVHGHRYGKVVTERNRKKHHIVKMDCCGIEGRVHECHLEKEDTV